MITLDKAHHIIDATDKCVTNKCLREISRLIKQRAKRTLFFAYYKLKPKADVTAIREKLQAVGFTVDDSALPQYDILITW